MGEKLTVADMRDLLAMMKISYSLIHMVLACVYTFVKIDYILGLKCLYYIVDKVYRTI